MTAQSPNKRSNLLTDLWRSQSENRALRKAHALVNEKRYPEAIRLLTKANCRLHSSAIEILLVNLRHDSFFHHVPISSFASWPPRPDDLYADQPGIPEIDHQDFTATNVASGVFNHGSIIVRNMLTADQVSLMRDSIIQTYAQHDKAMAGAPETETAPWFVPFNPAPHEGAKVTIERGWYRQGGAELASDSPRGLFNLINCLQDAGITDMVTEYLGERPALSVRKTSLRQIPKDHNAENGWHQDGAFLGQGIRTVNVWIALTDCGVDAPSMDMVPRRMTEIVPTGTEGAMFNWSVSQLAVRDAAGDTPPVRLQFREGDAIIFDEMNLHRTGGGPGMTKDRFAIEAWFFAPSCYPLEQLPMMV